MLIELMLPEAMEGKASPVSGEALSSEITPARPNPGLQVFWLGQQEIFFLVVSFGNFVLLFVENPPPSYWGCHQCPLQVLEDWD